VKADAEAGADGKTVRALVTADASARGFWIVAGDAGAGSGVRVGVPAYPRICG
jgi:hypothetical protein